MKVPALQVFFTLCLGFFAVAAANAAVLGFSSVVDRVYPLGNGSVILVFRDSPASCLNASNPKYFHLMVGQQGVTEQGRNNIYAAALAAAASKAPVTVFFDDATSNCYINRMFVSF